MVIDDTFALTEAGDCVAWTHGVYAWDHAGQRVAGTIYHRAGFQFIGSVVAKSAERTIGEFTANLADGTQIVMRDDTDRTDPKRVRIVASLREGDGWAERDPIYWTRLEPASWPCEAAARNRPAPAAASSLPSEAARRLDTLHGTWDSTWEWLDPQGAVARVVHGAEVATWAIEGRVLELTTTTDDSPMASKAWVFYSDEDARFHVVSVDPKGSLWTLAGDLEAHVLTSPPKTMPDGREMTLRFDHDESDPDRLRANMHYRLNDGEWIHGFRQTLTRRTD